MDSDPFITEPPRRGGGGKARDIGCMRKRHTRRPRPCRGGPLKTRLPRAGRMRDRARGYSPGPLPGPRESRAGHALTPELNTGPTAPRGVPRGHATRGSIPRLFPFAPVALFENLRVTLSPLRALCPSSAPSALKLERATIPRLRFGLVGRSSLFSILYSLFSTSQSPSPRSSPRPGTAPPRPSLRSAASSDG